MQDELWNGRLAEMVRLIEQQEQGGLAPEDASWLAELKREVEAQRLAEAQAQYKRDAMVTRLMFEMNRVRAVELLEEMNRELLNHQGRVEPVYTNRHELSLSWGAPGGRNQIRVGAEFDEDSSQLFLVVTAEDTQRLPATEDELKKALVQAFRAPHFDIYRW